MLKRSMDELIEMQDKAIHALHQANEALRFALEVLMRHRAELGHQQSIPFELGYRSIPFKGGQEFYNTPGIPITTTTVKGWNPQNGYANATAIQSGEQAKTSIYPYPQADAVKITSENYAI